MEAKKERLGSNIKSAQGMRHTVRPIPSPGLIKNVLATGK